jgi:phospholipase/carboxylesterase
MRDLRRPRTREIPMSEPVLPSVEIHPGREAEASVIWLHGLGADGYDFASVPPQLGLPDDLAVRFVFPHAPAIPVTLNAGFVMPAWYDIASLTERGHDEEGVLASSRRVTALIAREIERGVPAGRIVLGGFSQGGAVALHAGLRHPERLAGLMGLSCYLLRADSLDEEAASANADVPMLLCHGNRDPMVPIDLGRASRDALQARGHGVEWHEYPIEHSVSLPELRDVAAWLVRVLG